MKIVGVSGSGRKGGNTSVLVKAILDGAKSSGAKTTFIELADWTMAPCDASRVCKKTQACTIKDDMQKFYALAPETDVLVLGSPIYLDHVTANVMTFIQRLYCYIGPDIKTRWPRKNVRLVLGITYGWDDPHGYDDVLAWTRERFEYYFAIPTISTFALPAMKHDRIIDAEDPDIIRAREFGEALKGAM